LGCKFVNKVKLTEIDCQLYFWLILYKHIPGKNDQKIKTKLKKNNIDNRNITLSFAPGGKFQI